MLSSIVSKRGSPTARSVRAGSRHSAAQFLEKWLTGPFQFLFQTRRAIAVSACPGLGPIRIAALTSVVCILHPRQFEILLPIRLLFQQRRRTVANFHPARSLIRTQPRLLHVPQILALGD